MARDRNKVTGRGQRSVICLGRLCKDAGPVDAKLKTFAHTKAAIPAVDVLLPSRTEVADCL